MMKTVTERCAVVRRQHKDLNILVIERLLYVGILCNYGQRKVGITGRPCVVVRVIAGREGHTGNSGPKFCHLLDTLAHRGGVFATPMIEPYVLRQWRCRRDYGSNR